MCSRIVTLVFSVTPHILTVKNLHRVSTVVPVHCLMHCHTPYTNSSELHRVGTGLWRFVGYVQKDRVIGFTVTLHILTVRNCTESGPTFPCIVQCIVTLFTESEQVYGVLKSIR